MPIPNPNDYVTSAEFGRWSQEQHEFRARLESRTTEQHKEIVESLHRIEDQVRETNGRTRNAENCIKTLQAELTAIKDEDASIEQTVTDIKEHGCRQLEQHSEVVRTIGWSAQKKAAVAGGLVGTGALIWPALTEIARAIQTLLDHT